MGKDDDQAEQHQEDHRGMRNLVANAFDDIKEFLHTGFFGGARGAHGKGLSLRAQSGKIPYGHQIKVCEALFR